MTHILLVEDEDFFRQTLTDYLTFKKFKVTEAPNGKVAKDLLTAGNNYDIVLSDVQMPLMNGVDLLRWMQSTRPTPFILMTGFTNLLETQSAYDLGANEFLSKPFKNKELLEVLQRTVATIQKTVGVAEAPQRPGTHGSVVVREVVQKSFTDYISSDENGEDEFYCKVSIDEFVSRNQIDFDLFIRLGAKKFIKIANNGQKLESERIHTYREKGLQYLYVKKEDFNKVVHFNLQITHLLKDAKNISVEKKMNFMKYAGEVLLEDCFINGVAQDAVNDAKDLMDSTMEVLSQSDDMMDMLSMFSSITDPFYAHSVCTAMYAVLIAKELGTVSEKEMQHLATAGLFHDIGKRELDRSLFEKSRFQLTPVERKAVESHVIRSREILESIPDISPVVLRLVFEHHEDEIGLGFPQGLKGHQLHHLSRILIVANKFSELALKRDNKNKLTGYQAVCFIEETNTDRLNADIVNVLKSIFIKSKAKTA